MADIACPTSTWAPILISNRLCSGVFDAEIVRSRDEVLTIGSCVFGSCVFVFSFPTDEGPWTETFWTNPKFNCCML